jgi:phosphoribosylanthranilate isomerase
VQDVVSRKFSELDSGNDSRFLSKVCGITNLEDALLSVELGANCLGFNFYPKSPRFLKPQAAARIIEKLPQEVIFFGIMVLGRDGAGVWRELEGLLDGLQVHGARDDAELAEFGDMPLLVAIAPDQAEEFPNRSVIVDTSWGTGRLTSWEQVARIRRPFVLSGGLTADNVADAICILRPLGVDVCSGVERSPGRKDPEKLSRFLAAVRNSVCLAGADERKGSRR